MDPGLLVANSIMPSEKERLKQPTKPQLQLPDGFLEKSHVRHALKYMSDNEQRNKALEVALAWKKKFQAREWKSVVAGIEAFSKEDNLRLSAPNAESAEQLSTIHSAERPRAIPTASAPPVPQVTSRTKAAGADLARMQTETASLPLQYWAPMTPRYAYRWDEMPTGPVTPLSPMPIGNSFAGGGFWEGSPLQTEPSPEETSALTTASNCEPVSLVAPTDPGARAAYEKVKADVEHLARRYCLSRHHMRSSAGENDFVPATMVRPRDMLRGAQVALSHGQLKLKTTIIKDLPERLQIHAVEEAALQRQLCIRTLSELEEQNDWMNHDTFIHRPGDLDPEVHKIPLHLCVSILDEQRVALRMLRSVQRKHTDLLISDKALEAAWAVRVLEDMQRTVLCEDDSSSSGGYDDEGYNYGNILRNIKSEMEERPPDSMVDASSNSDFTSLRSRATTNQTVSSHKSSFSAIHKNSGTLQRPTQLRISTESTEEVPSGELSPEDREFRHRGPNLADLDIWAEELKNMETMRAGRQRSPIPHPRRLICKNGSNTFASVQRSAQALKRASLDSINTRISPPKSLHSRFSFSSSSSGAILSMRSGSSAHHTTSSARSVHSSNTAKYTMLDHQYHQRKANKARAKSHNRKADQAPIYGSLVVPQHLRSTSSVAPLVKGTTQEAEDEWAAELKSMESRERTRQYRERAVSTESSASVGGAERAIAEATGQGENGKKDLAEPGTAR